MEKIGTEGRRRIDSTFSSKKELHLTSSGSRFIEEQSHKSKFVDKRRSALSVDYNGSTRPGTNAMTTEMSGTFNVTQNFTRKKGPTGKLQPSTPHQIIRIKKRSIVENYPMMQSDDKP